MLFLLYIVFYLSSTAGILSIGFLAYRSNKTRQNKYFALFAAFLSLWLLLQFAAQVLHQYHGAALFLLRYAISLAPLMGYEFLLFSHEYTNGKLLGAKYLLSVPLFVLAVGWTPYAVESADITRSGIAIQQVGIVYGLVLLYVVAVFLKGLYMIIRDYTKYRRLDRSRASRSRLLIFSLLQLLVVAVGGSIFLTSSIISQILIPISALIMIGVVGYAVVRHQLFNVRLIIARALAYLLVLSTIAVGFSVVVFGVLERVLPLASGVSGLRQIPYLITALAIGLTLRPLRLFFDRLTKRLFYRDAYDSQELLDSLGTLFALEIDIEKIATQSLGTICRELKLLHGRLVIINDDDSLRVTTYGSPERVEINPDLLSRVKGRIVAADSANLSNLNRLDLQGLDVSVVVRLLTQDGSVGYLLLGPKKSGNAYSKQDMDVLTIISNEMAVAVQNSLLFERVNQFNATLQRRINEATDRLRETNKRLKLLDETKDDFISMASHQLRTPLTSVKGYLSMVLEGDVGPLSDSQRKLLEQSYRSSQQMVYLISDLLNLSRLNTGKFIIEPMPVDLGEVVQSEVEQLIQTAKARELTLIYDKPNVFPKLMLDETKTRQVIMNFIDNAIYYTPAGGTVTVGLRETPTAVEFTVRDTGIGVPKAVQRKLFTKFYRAQNAQKARPDGTGLGLFMAKKVMVAQGGSIIFESEEGKGSTFGFRFSKARHLAPAESAKA